jgi:SAM-dependent methyltransferase
MGSWRKKAYLHYESMLAKTQSRSDKDIALNLALFRKNLAPHLPAAKRAAILDLGSGFGDLLFFLREAGYTGAMGVDISARNADICRGRGLKVETGDAMEFLRAQKEGFDVIILYDVLEHHDKEEGLALMEMAAARLKPGGKALIVVPNMGNPFTAARGRYADWTHESGYSQESLSFMLEVAGFKGVRIHSIDHFVLPNPLANLVGRAALSLVYAGLRAMYLLHGVSSTTIYGKNILAVAERESRDAG